MGDRKTCGVNYFCVGAVLIFVGSILLCALGFSIIFPYFMTKDWVSARCLVHGGFYNERACTCNETPTLYAGCIYRYPCVQVYVSYVPVAGETLNATDKDAEQVAEVTYGDDDIDDGLVTLVVGGMSHDEVPEMGGITTSAVVNESLPLIGVDVAHAVAADQPRSSPMSSRRTGLWNSEIRDHRSQHARGYGAGMNVPYSSVMVDTSNHTMLYRSWADMFYNTVSSIRVQGVLSCYRYN